MLGAFEYVAILACLLFAGAAAYVSLIEHPARMECGLEVAVKALGASYERMMVMQVLLALVATVAGVSAWVSGGNLMWLIGATFIFFVVPFTYRVILPITLRLLNTAADSSSDATHGLLQKWGRVHGIRTLMSVMASLIFLSAGLCR